jgi:hypothetical protein
MPWFLFLCVLCCRPTGHRFSIFCCSIPVFVEHIHIREYKYIYLYLSLGVKTKPKQNPNLKPLAFSFSAKIPEEHEEKRKPKPNTHTRTKNQNQAITLTLTFWERNTSNPTTSVLLQPTLSFTPFSRIYFYNIHNTQNQNLSND